MVDKIKNLIPKPVLDLLTKLWTPVQTTIDVALDTPEKKNIAAATLIILEIILLYVVALLSVGIWISTANPFRILWHCISTDDTFPWMAFLFFSVIICAVFYVVLRLSLIDPDERNFDISESNVYGNAREISRDELGEVADIVPKDEAMGTVLGQLDRTEEHIISHRSRSNSNDNMVIFGASGSGKSFCFVKPFIVQAIRRGESVLVTDSKGEIWGETVELARRYGYIVRKIDLKNPLYSDGWDVLKELRCDDMRAIVFAQTVMKNTGNLTDPHISAEESLLIAVCLFVERNDMIATEDKTLYTAFTMLNSGAEELEKQFTAVRHNPKLKPALEYYKSFISGSERLKGNVISNLLNRLKVLASPPVQHITGTPDIDLTLPGKERCIYYIAISDQHEAMKFLSSLFFSFAYLDLSDYADSLPERCLPVPVNFLMEEMFSCVGFLPSLAQYLSTCRSRAIKFILIFQDIGQVMDLYGENLAGTVLGNCATHLCLGFNDQPTAEYFEWRSGQCTVKVKTEQHDAIDPMIRLGLRHSTGDGRRAFFTSNELMKMKTGRCLIVWQRYDCIMPHTLGINRYMEFQKGNMPVISPLTHVPLADTEARAFLRAKEEERVEKYKEWIAQGGNPWKDYLTPVHTNHGPATGTDVPAFVSYPDLEDMALEYSEQAKLTDEDRAKMQAAKVTPMDPEPDVYILPDDSQWELVEGWESDEEDEEYEAPAPQEPVPQISESPSESQQNIHVTTDEQAESAILDKKPSINVSDHIISDNNIGSPKATGKQKSKRPEGGLRATKTYSRK